MRSLPIAGACFLIVAAVSASFAQPIIKQAPPGKAEPTEDRFGLAPMTPLPLLYLDQESVRRELKMSAEQADKLAVLQKMPIERLVTNVGKELEAILSAEQRTRLQQIIWRHREREYGHPAILNALVNELDLSAEQRQRFDKARAKRADAVLEFLTSAERLPTIARQVHEANEEFIDQAEKLLTEKQQAKLKELRGKPFSGEIQLKQPERPRDQPNKNAYLRRLFAVYSFEPVFLGHESVQKELLMSEDQIRRALVFHAQWADRVDREKRALQLSGIGATESALAAILAQNRFVGGEHKEILHPEQHQRFREIMIQHRLEIGGLGAACGYPDVAETLKLTAVQATDLQYGRDPYQVLTAAQQTALNGMRGKPFKRDFKYDAHGIFEPAEEREKKPVAPIAFVDEKQNIFANYMIDKAKQLRLTDEQVARLKEIAEDTPRVRQLLHKELSNLPPPTVQGIRVLPEARAVEMHRKATLERCLGVLDEKQQSLFGAELRKAYRDY